MLMSNVGVNGDCCQHKELGCMCMRETNMEKMVRNRCKRSGGNKFGKLACERLCDTLAYDDPISYE